MMRDHTREGESFGGGADKRADTIAAMRYFFFILQVYHLYVLYIPGRRQVASEEKP